MPDQKFRAQATPFFNYACQRYQILLNRRAGLPREQWTKDEVLQTWSFCNIFREDDKVTIWFRENIREPMKEDHNVLFATIAFRWFNTIAAGEVMKPFLLTGSWLPTPLMARLNQRWKQDGKIVTGAYIIKTPPVLTKVEALVGLIQQAHEAVPQILGQWDYASMENCWQLIRMLPYMGDFTSYEVVTDLRHTGLLRNAQDLMRWANPGPGCAAGLGGLFHGDRDYFNRHSSYHRRVMLEDLMIPLLEMSRHPHYWPPEWPKWEMREVEHTLCEYDKYMRGWAGRRLKRRYRP